jgi:tetratricopeptide (TPR) repeat protein
MLGHLIKKILQGSPTRDLCAEAQALLDAGEIDRARVACSALLREEPGSAAAMRLLANIALAQGPHESDVAQVRAGVTRNPGDSALAYLHGCMLQAVNDLPGAATAYRDALGLDPNLAKAHNNLGCVLQAMGQTSGALACFRQALVCDPALSQAQDNLRSLQSAQAERPEFLMQSAYPDEEFERLYQVVSRYSIISKPETKSVYDRFLECLDLPGDLIEFGTYNGGLSLFLGLLLKRHAPGKKIYMLDSFEGLPATDDPLDGDFRDRGGEFAANLDRVKEAIREFELDDIAVVHPGWFHESVRTLPPDLSVSLAHVDGDLYESTKVALDYILPRLDEGGAILMDDFYSARTIGVATAFKESDARDTVLHLGPDSQAYIFPRGRRGGPRPDAVWLEEGGLRYDASDLLQDTRYMQHVSEKLAAYRFNEVIHRLLAQCVALHQGRASR